MSNNILSLNNLRIGKKAVVTDINTTGVEKQRMLDLGLVRGASIEALHKSPAGDPTAYFIMGAVIALRGEDAKNVLIQESN